MKKKKLEKVKKTVIKELTCIFFAMLFNGLINLLLTYFAKKTQLASSAMERHEISRVEFEFINNFQNIGSTVLFFGNILILAIMVLIVVNHIKNK